MKTGDKVRCIDTYRDISMYLTENKIYTIKSIVGIDVDLEENDTYSWKTWRFELVEPVLESIK